VGGQNSSFALTFAAHNSNNRKTKKQICLVATQQVWASNTPPKLRDYPSLCNYSEFIRPKSFQGTSFLEIRLLVTTAIKEKGNPVILFVCVFVGIAFVRELLPAAPDCVRVQSLNKRLEGRFTLPTTLRQRDKSRSLFKDHQAGPSSVFT
jgi:hypothetical protein